MKKLLLFAFILPFVSSGYTTIPLNSSSQGSYLLMLLGEDINQVTPNAFMHAESDGLYFSTIYSLDSVGLPTPEYAASIVSLPAKYIKKEGNLLVEMPQEEKEAVDAAEAAAIAEAEAARQASKPLEQRQYENAFFELTEQVLTLSSDERAGQTPPVKLGFDELNVLLEALFDSDMATATKLSIKLLSIDSALKRYNTLWWDDVIKHEIPEE